MYVYELVNPDGGTIQIYSNPISAIQAFAERREISPNCYPKISTEYRWYNNSLQFKNRDTHGRWESWDDYNLENGKDVFCVYRSRVYD